MAKMGATRSPKVIQCFIVRVSFSVFLRGPRNPQQPWCVLVFEVNFLSKAMRVTTADDWFRTNYEGDWFRPWRIRCFVCCKVSGWLSGPLSRLRTRAALWDIRPSACPGQWVDVRPNGDVERASGEGAVQGCQAGTKHLRISGNQEHRTALGRQHRRAIRSHNDLSVVHVVCLRDRRLIRSRRLGRVGSWVVRGGDSVRTRYTEMANKSGAWGETLCLSARDGLARRFGRCAW